MDSYTLIKNELCTHIEEGETFSLTQPEEFAHGTFATNIAFIIAKEKNLSPKFCATELIPILEEKLSGTVEKIEVAGPGFINFFVKDEVIRKENEKKDVHIVTRYTGKNILVEHSSPNLFKPFNVGHLMNNVVGEFVAQAMRVGGGNVVTMSFPSDVSLSIAKGLYILLEDRKKSDTPVKYEEFATTQEKVAYFGDCYARGVAYFNEHEDEIEKAKKLASIMYDKQSSSSEREIFTDIRGINNFYLRKDILADFIGSHIDCVIYESDVSEDGARIVRDHVGSIFRESEGAIIYEPDESRKDLHTQVFINSEGYPTYEAKDLGLLEWKFTKPLGNESGAFNPEYSYFITDAEQIPHFKVVLDAASKLGEVWRTRAKKSIHVPHGRMLFRGARMSSRLGGVPTAKEVIDIVTDEVRERAGEKIAYLDEDEKKKLEREIALSALRIAVLRSKPGININFDPETSLSFEGDSGPYLLYTHARCSSLLQKAREKAQEKNIPPRFQTIPVTPLERNLAFFEVMLTESVESLSPQKLVTYLFVIAQEFNSLYASTQLVSDNLITTAHNMAITERAKLVLKEGLYILGISAPERM